ncbi:MAG TPA: flagellar basal body rod C-terminal domain-containing protein, partial [Bacillota bacterium]|nr:flagellar basal body rod C-terminal domain-containing protein [Bacillota bacterium]
VVWESNNTPAYINNGKIKGLLEMRDQEVGYYIDTLNDFARELAENFNTAHRAGYGLEDTTGTNFFINNTNGSPWNIDASNIEVNPAVTADLKLIAASVDLYSPPEVTTHGGAPGNGANAQKMANVINRDLLMSNQTFTITEFYNGLIAKLGIDAEKSNSTLSNQETLINYLQDRQESVAGVSMDEELTNMIKFQNAYNASARYVTAIDELLERLINGTGTVGR